MARQRKLTPEKRALLENIRQSYNPKDADDVQDMLKDLLGDMLQEMLESDMDDQLGYSFILCEFLFLAYLYSTTGRVLSPYKKIHG